MTIPSKGEKTLATVLTVSIVDMTPPFAIFVEGLGSSMKTISQSYFWAWSETPMVSTSPSNLTHSWVFENFMIENIRRRVWENDVTGDIEESIISYYIFGSFVNIEINYFKNK